MVPFRPFLTRRPLDPLRPVNALRTLVLHAMALRPIVMVLYVLLAVVFPVGLVLVLSVLPVVLPVIVTIMASMFVVMLVVIMLSARVPVAFHVAHLHAQLVRDLAPAHAARAQLQHAGKRDPLTRLGSDRAAVQRRLDLLGRGLVDAVLGKRGLRQAERQVDVAVAHLVGGRLEARSLAALGEIDLRVVAQALDQLAGVPVGAGEAVILFDQLVLGSMVAVMAVLPVFAIRQCL